jgi:hypothetical protein
MAPALDFDAILAKASDSFDLPRPLKSPLWNDATWIGFTKRAEAYGFIRVEVHKNDDNPDLAIVVAGITHGRLKEETRRVLSPSEMSLIACLTKCLPEELEVIPGTWQSSSRITAPHGNVHFQLEVQVREKTRAN